MVVQRVCLARTESPLIFNLILIFNFALGRTIAGLCWFESALVIFAIFGFSSFGGVPPKASWRLPAPDKAVRAEFAHLLRCRNASRLGSWQSRVKPQHNAVVVVIHRDQASLCPFLDIGAIASRPESAVWGIPAPQHIRTLPIAVGPAVGMVTGPDQLASNCGPLPHIFATESLINLPRAMLITCVS